MRKTFSLVLALLGVVGCATYEPGKSFEGDDACGTGNCIAYVDFRDTGLFQDSEQFEVLWPVLDTCQDKVVVLFVHGLQGSSREDSDYVRGFRQLIHQIAVEANASGTFQVVGVYVGWRGQSWIFPTLAPLTFGARRDAAKAVAHGQFYEFYQRLSGLRRQPSTRCSTLRTFRLVVIGHSLGGSIVFEAAWRDLLRQAIEANLKSPGSLLKLAPQADRVVLINPAIAAIDFAPFYEGLKPLRFDPQQKPLLEIYFAQEDTVVSTWFSAFRRVETITYDPTEKRELLTTPIGGVAQFLTHTLETLDCSQRAPSKVADANNRRIPTRVIRAENVPEFRQHGDLWKLAESCIRTMLADQTEPMP